MYLHLSQTERFATGRFSETEVKVQGEQSTEGEEEEDAPGVLLTERTEFRYKSVSRSNRNVSTMPLPLTKISPRSVNEYLIL